MIKNDQISLIINTTEGKQAIADSYSIRREALMHKISYTTTIAAAQPPARPCANSTMGRELPPGSAPELHA